MKEILIKEGDSQQRFDKYLRRLFPQAAGGFLYKMLRKKNITLNGRKATGRELLNAGDKVKIFFSDETFDKFADSSASDSYYDDLSSIKRRPTVIYEDEDIILMHKGAGVLSQKAKDTDISINEMMLAYLIEKGELSRQSFATFRPSVMNRLDYNTTGIILGAKNLAASRRIAEDIRNDNIRKLYHAVVMGKCNIRDRAVHYLVKDEGRNMVSIYDEPTDSSVEIATIYTPIEVSEDVTLMECELITGRSHQLRAQLAHMGHPIIGDSKYGRSTLPGGQLLHAYKLILADGREFVDDDPPEFYDYLKG